MIVRKLANIVGTEREVGTASWTSRRLLLKTDRLGFSMHDTEVQAGSEIYMWYKYHLEAVYCVEGEGEVEDLEDKKRHPITPGTLYALNQNDKHILRAKTRLRLVCVFNPPLNGNEVHDEEGVYPLVTETEEENPTSS
ncbi:MAG: L-ectoine synthase [Nitrospinaceae bacterium]|nr:ectoine synthase [Nitrospinaceae bacterium]NIR56154.1 ectoine synthase [Nitrospinaceae bacterium]NIS86610.1 ectoine synthase [Nitrospinaceae bacterium]NIT83440.1 ectoine synthase [Nitrospinaceae bacterium]NIU45648.1 ectoine synthase [Nitrospinaceae bacterium]